jgi:serine phosphatase RsbU (regulator of sigma subunit)
LSRRLGIFLTFLVVGGAVAFLLATTATVDLALPRPWDGVVLEGDLPGTLAVRGVVPGSGADHAGIRPGDRIVGIDREVLRSPTHAAELLGRRKIGETVPYLVERADGVREVRVQLGRRYLGSASYFYACLLGFLFFTVGVFVLRRQPDRRPAQIFYLVCVLFLLFLVCRLRPASYSWVDRVALDAGTLALLLLPACFLHFFLIFPRPVALRPRPGQPGFARLRRRWLAVLAAIYLLPVAVLGGQLAWAGLHDRSLRLISGTPIANWWLLAVYMTVGLAVLGRSYARLTDAREKRGVALVLLGSVVGLLPFLATAVALPEQLGTGKLLLGGLGLLVAVPVTFAVSIVRFGLLDVQVILRKSLAYTALTAGITLFYALGIAFFNALTRGTELAQSPWFPVVFALAIALLFEPMRRRAEKVADRLLYAERGHLQEAMRGLAEAMSAQVDLRTVVSDLVERLPRLLGLRFAGLYLLRDGRLERVAGPGALPAALPYEPALHDHLARGRRLARLADLETSAPETPAVGALVAWLGGSGVDLVGDLATPRRRIGLVVFAGPGGRVSLDEEELALLGGLLGQAAVALETSLLVEERTRQAELERELEIASTVQTQLLPARLSLGRGWRVAAACRPARHVGGDFYAELPGPGDGGKALVIGDVAGKSVAGALVMMAAHEALQTLALLHREPAKLFAFANQRLYRLGQKKSFVAVVWMTASSDGEGLDYVLAGQPQLLLRAADGVVRELPAPVHRLPLGAMLENGYQVCHAPVGPGEIVLGYSDGVLDALSPAGEQFGAERLAAVLSAAPADPDAVIEQVLFALRHFTEGAEPYDDITMVALARDRGDSSCASSG